MDLHSIREILNHSWARRLLAILAYLLLAKMVDLFIQRVLKRFAQNYTDTDLDDRAIEILHFPVMLSAFFFGLLHAVSLKPAFEAPWGNILPATIKTTLLMVWAVTLLRLFSMLADWYFEKKGSQGKIGTDLLLLFKNVIRIVVVASFFLWILSVWNINLAPLFASAGIAGIAVALAAKDTLANFFGGISIFADRTFTVGDYVMLDSGERGEVIEVGIRSTRIRTFSDTIITIPNSILANSRIINESVPVARFRIRVPVGVAYGSDLDQVEEVLLAVARANPNILVDPEPRVRVRAFGASSVDIELFCWVERPENGLLEVHRLLKGIYVAFNENRIVIPFPQQDVHLVSLPKNEHSWMGNHPSDQGRPQTVGHSGSCPRNQDGSS